MSIYVYLSYYFLDNNFELLKIEQIAFQNAWLFADNLTINNRFINLYAFLYERNATLVRYFTSFQNYLQLQFSFYDLVVRRPTTSKSITFVKNEFHHMCTYLPSDEISENYCFVIFAKYWNYCEILDSFR